MANPIRRAMLGAFVRAFLRASTPLWLAVAIMVWAPLLLAPEAPPPRWLAVGAASLTGLGFILAIAWAAARARALAPKHVARAAERDWGLAHQPLSGRRDTLARELRGNAQTQGLWRAHAERERARTDARFAQARPPKIGWLAWAPPALALAALLAAFAHPQGGARLSASLAPKAVPPEPLEVAIWAVPPAWAREPAQGLPPRGGEAQARSDSLVRLSLAARRAKVSWRTGDDATTTTLRQDANGLIAWSRPLDADATLTITSQGREAHWQLTALPNRPPSATWVSPPAPLPSGALDIAWFMRDDHGLAGGRLAIALNLAKPSDILRAATPPAVILPIPFAKEARDAIQRDFASHPWAGLPVVAQLVAQDAAGLEGASAPARFVLPATDFDDDLARALETTRQDLARAGLAGVGRAGARLDRLAPSEGTPSLAALPTFVAVRAARHLLSTARASPEDRITDALEAMDIMHRAASAIEDGDLSAALEALRERREALQRGLAEEAGAKEISELAEALREAYDRAIAALREALPASALARLPSITQDHALRELLKRAEDLARVGAYDRAREALERFSAALERLADPDTARVAADIAETMSRLQALAQRQIDAAEATWQARKEANAQDGAREASAQAFARQARRDNLPDQQEALRQELGALQNQANALAREHPDIQRALPAPALAAIGETMARAARALREGAANEAVGHQQQAVAELSAVIGQFAEALRRAGGAPEFGAFNPLGSPGRGGVPDAAIRLPTDDASRARGVRDELRRRAQDLERPQAEREYLQRLLERFP